MNSKHWFINLVNDDRHSFSNIFCFVCFWNVTCLELCTSSCKTTAVSLMGFYINLWEMSYHIWGEFGANIFTWQGFLLSVPVDTNCTDPEFTKIENSCSQNAMLCVRSDHFHDLKPYTPQPAASVAASTAVLAKFQVQQQHTAASMSNRWGNTQEPPHFLPASQG